ncbi:hypothetical protein [Mycobacterium sp.]|uniref:hypothetical protein n=1 Tax=Mycobacterium sp. TaxID=1785 RepID=UPI003D6C6EFF
MMLSVAEYAAQIRDWAIFDKEYRQHNGEPPVDPNVVFDFSRVAAVWERLRWDMHTKGASPGDRNRLNELTDKLQRLATQLGLGKVDPDSFLPGDPARLLAQGPGNTIEPWFEHCMYAPRGW